MSESCITTIFQTDVTDKLAEKETLYPLYPSTLYQFHFPNFIMFSPSFYQLPALKFNMISLFIFFTSSSIQRCMKIQKKNSPFYDGNWYNCFERKLIIFYDHVIIHNVTVSGYDKALNLAFFFNRFKFFKPHQVYFLVEFLFKNELK